jgi:VacB/RNase II family 3'-5' exoribonuclease
MTDSPAHQREHLQAIARQAMHDRALEPDFSPQAEAELAHIQGPARPDAVTADGAGSGAAPAGGAHGAAGSGAPGGTAAGGDAVRDLRPLLWCSIDNDDSRDLDQLSVARTPAAGAAGGADGALTVLVAIADVDALVHLGSAIDAHAQANTTTVYTAGGIFPMLPLRLSTDLTSLGESADRMSIVVEMTVEPDGEVTSSAVYRAWVRNQAKLAYHGVGDWLEGHGEAPARLAAVAGLGDNLHLQDTAAQRLRALRFKNGALDLRTIETNAVFAGDRILDLAEDQPNRARHLIEDFMVAANGVVARFLAAAGLPSMRRVVRTPKRWSRIVELAATFGEHLPAEPDSAALSAFLERRRRADALRFPDLSLSVVKLLGAGEYVAEAPGSEAPGHFGLAVRDYSHSTAPNRRYPDIITQRLLKAALAKRPAPYSLDQLQALATHCTEKEDDAQKVERRVHKSAAAMLLSSHIGQSYDGVVTGAADKGTWVRIFQPPVEGRLVHGFEGLDVGDKVHVRLTAADVDRGFIDFARQGGR